MKRQTLYVLLALLAILPLGCGAAGPPTVRVSGVVTVNGKPVEGVEVHFEGENFSGYGKTDAEGRYKLIQGAAVGSNRVYFSKMEGGPPGAKQVEGIDETQLQIMAEASGGKAAVNVPRQTIPSEYSDPANTKLSFTVPSGGTDAANFDL